VIVIIISVMTFVLDFPCRVELSFVAQP